MSYCLNPDCQRTIGNPPATKFCQSCGSKLLLKDRYRAIELIAQGGFGRTFLAVDEDKPSQPRCVIKQFLPVVAGFVPAQGSNAAQKAAELFEQEAVRLDELGKHPQIPELLAHFEVDARQYLVQEFIEGQNLAQALEAEGPFWETQIWDLLSSLLPVLEFIHSHNVIHRDIKPENIIRRPSPDRGDGQKRGSELVLVDFGAAKLMTGTALLKTGTTIGSPEYIAPEQVRGKAVFASDLYSLGITCIHLLTQISPFDLFDTTESAWVWRQYLVGNPVSDELGCILDKLIENATNRRYSSALAVLQDLNPHEPQISSLQPIALPPAMLAPASKLTIQNWCCIHTLTAHIDSVLSVAFNQDGQTLASGSSDKTIKLWRLQNGQHIRTFKGHTPWVTSFAFSPDGQLIASGSGDKTVKIWRVKDGQDMCTLWGHTHWVRSVAFSPNGFLVASGSSDNTIRIWRVKDREKIRTLAGHTYAVYTVAFSPDGRLLASGSIDRTIKIWRVQDGQQIRTLADHGNWINSVAFSPDGCLLASASHDNTVKIWRFKDDKEILTLKEHTDAVVSIAFSPDGQTLASASHDNTVKIWQVQNGQEIFTLRGHTESVVSVAFSPDGQTLASGSHDNTIKLWRCIS